MVTTWLKKWNDNKVVRRFRSLNKILRRIFNVACCSIILVELWLKPLSESHPTLLRIEDIYLKLCYSIAGSTIFFFINVHWPRQEDKMNFRVHIFGRVGWMYSEIQFVIEYVFNVAVKIHPEGNTFDEQLLKQACENFDPNKSFSMPHLPNQTFTWITYRRVFYESIAQKVDEIVTVPEIVDKSTMLKLLKIKDLARLICKETRHNDKPVAKWISDMFYKSHEIARQVVPKSKYKF